MFLIKILTLVFILTIMHCPADIYTPSATLYQPIGSTDYRIDLGAVFTTFSLDPLTDELTRKGDTLGTSVSWFSVSEGMVINSETASAASELRTLLMPTESFFLGYCQFYLEAPSDPFLDYAFGWVELEYDGNNLFLLGSAEERDGQGIIAGQYVQVPEPSSIALLLVSGGGIYIGRRRIRR